MIPSVNASNSIFRSFEGRNYRLDPDGKLFVEQAGRDLRDGRRSDRKKWRQCTPTSKRSMLALAHFQQELKAGE